MSGRDLTPVPANAGDPHHIVKLKRILAEEHLKVAEQGGHAAAIRVLVQIVAGKDGEGRPIAANARDKIQAARALLRSAGDVIASEEERPAGAAQIQINIGVPSLVKPVAQAAPPAFPAAPTPPILPANGLGPVPRAEPA